MIRSPVEPDFFVFALPSRGNCSNLRGSLLRSSFRATAAAPTPAETVPGQGLKQPGSWLDPLPVLPRQALIFKLDLEAGCVSSQAGCASYLLSTLPTTQSHIWV
ncbi:hypothetical protein H9L39_08979 [Fusarium oxysporum f. sp. albedinis]|nr:hypothetical protein H9L39_08979 [Fusarium oxysporum f. sp. albedinis]